ncbi:WD40 repeat domain-containing protein, partial [Salmonella sp. s51228]|uniref:WD40 repeat domain-containing protein n=1 Tax=Salmonella sp. s51228 TaxID=3159652 RepID=UPI00397EFEE6
MHTLSEHEGPVWQVAWAHPQFGSILASCSYDRRVLFWKEMDNVVWEVLYEYRGHTSSVNSIAFSPPDWNLTLACASSDGTIYVISNNLKAGSSRTGE